jgi:predicted nuclease of predicted toxin-antitoxin system
MQMRLLANENIPFDAVKALRENGYDVLWTREDSPGSTDVEVLETAQEQDRVLITFDKDFGELAFRSKRPAASGIILFRTPMNSPAEVARFLSNAIRSRDDWKGHFSVVETDRVRMRRLRKRVE